jgi:hypothetical protein
MVLVDADPLADIRNTRRIHAVIANGRVIDRAALLRRAEAFRAAMNGMGLTRSQRS